MTKETIEVIGMRAKKASRQLAFLTAEKKTAILKAIGKALLTNRDLIKKENERDIKQAQKDGQTFAIIDRMTLTDERITAMADSLDELAALDDPIGEVLTGWTHPDGLDIIQKRVPIGVIGMIYESRPNVTVDSAALALKSSNAIILRGSSSAIHSNTILEKIIREAGEKEGLPQYAVQLITDTDRKRVLEMVTLDQAIDVLIPRGGKNLKTFIIENATIPVIETGSGVCTAYVDDSADSQKAIAIITNAKTQRPSTCNSIETVLVHQSIAPTLLPLLTQELLQKEVELRYDQKALDYLPDSVQKQVKLAQEDDFGAEYLDMILSLKIVSDLDEAIDYINEHGTHHSDTIITETIEHGERFLKTVDSAVVYLNASTRFSDGGEFGFGGEIGISTQKLHARGPMSYKELTTSKYIVRGNGQVRK